MEKNLEKKEGKSDEKKIKTESKNYSREFVKIIAGICFVLIVSFLVFLFIKNMGKFEYGGMEFEKNQVGEITFYKTILPLKQDGKSLDLSVYFRNSPEKVYKVLFNGSIPTRELMVINSTDEFICDGDGVIGVQNVVNNFGYFGIKSVQDKNATCDSQGRYLFVEIDAGNETKIVQDSETCYTIKVNNCEILIATERFLLQKVKQTNDLIKRKN